MLSSFCSETPAVIERQLAERGAVLLRGFAVDGPEAFAAAIAPIVTSTDYIGGISPRRKIAGQVYESTYYPPHLEIKLHNELAHLRSWPLRIAFACIEPAREGGHTPFADGRLILQRIGVRTRDELADRKLRYAYTYPPPPADDGPLARRRFKSWCEAFGTRDRETIERACTEAGLDYRWNADGSLTTLSVRDAFVHHPRSGELVWFNQILLRNAFRLRLRTDRPTGGESLACTFGDGEPLDRALLDEVDRVSASCTVDFPWERGDVLVLDNGMWSHGRPAVVGDRSVLCVLGD